MDEDRPFRVRLLDGLAASIAEHGYRTTTVADIVRHARTSKRTFYSQFPDKEQCFIELLRTDHEQLLATIRAAVDPEADRSWMELLYLSFTTLSSTGLSDVVPVRAFARGLVMLEQIAGLGYMAMVVSRLVGLLVMRRAEHDLD